MKKLSKRAMTLLLALMCLFTVALSSACSADNNIISVGAGKISDGVFAYYLNEAIDEKYSADSGTIILNATEKTRYYVKTNAFSSESGVTLTIAEKAAVSKRVNDLWGVFGEYYKSIGVSKQTITKIYTSEAFESKFLEFFYGENGQEAPSAEELEACFNDNFIVFKSINGYYEKTNYSGETVALSEPERELLITRYKDTAAAINSGSSSIEAAVSSLSDGADSGTPDTLVMQKGSSDYPAEFFDGVSAAEANTATVITTDENVFLVLKEAVSIDSSYYQQNRSYVLSVLKGDELEQKLAGARTYNAELSQRRAVELYNKIVKAKTDA